MITGKVPRKDKGGNVVVDNLATAARVSTTAFVDTLATAAVAIIKALKDPSPSTAPANKGMCTPGGMSLAKKVELRSQYLRQLKEIQNRGCSYSGRVSS